MIRLTLPLITAALFILSPSVTADYVYKCQTPEGKKVFSGFPCGPNYVRDEYKNLAPAKRAVENLPPRQGELLNGTLTDKKKANSTTDTETPTPNKQ